MSSQAAREQDFSTSYLLTHFSDAHLLQELKSLLVTENESTALLLAHIAEVDARRLYAPAGCSSMFSYCVEKLHLSEDAAYRRIRAARAARQFPVLFDAVAEGRLHLAAVSAIAPYLTHDNVGSLIKDATHRRKSDIEELLASRFPSATPEHRTIVRAIPSLVGSPTKESDHDQLVLGRVEVQPEHELVLGRVEERSGIASPKGADVELVLGRVEEQSKPRFLVQVTITQSTRAKLRKAQALLSHAVPSGDVAQVLDRALDALIAQLERRKTGSPRPRTRTPRQVPAPPSSHEPRKRYIPAQVRRAVWERDACRCTFVGDDGHRCSETRFLEFDHVEPFARGGRSTVDGLRLRCRSHNQHTAERVFGSAFMNDKREMVRRRSVAKASTRRETQDVVAGLRALGCRVDEARRAAEFAWSRGSTLEERLRVALQSLARRPHG